MKAYFSSVRQVVKVVVDINQRIQSIKITDTAGNQTVLPYYSYICE
ncbi:MAG: hypothetical protein JNM36_16785 [Chitinophagales bacterium]|nr:hypothetical protein [Chitinophagales bacterium]HNI43186.1 hypothetical protein [Chitinophagales bacterium]HNL06581.1 hypothetical protein [Chitinophagales bacterium]